MGNHCSDDAAGSPSSSFIQSPRFTHESSSQPLAPDHSFTISLTDPPSRSPSPLNLSPHATEEVGIPDSSVIPTLTGSETNQSFDPSDSDLESVTSDSQSLRSGSPPIEMNPSTVRYNLKLKGFYYDDQKALIRGGRAILSRAVEIMTSQRHSPTSKEMAPMLQNAIAKYCGSTERTLVFNVWHILRQKEIRDVVEKPLSPQQEGEALKWVKRAWSKDFLDCVFEADLTKDLIPDTSHTVGFKLHNCRHSRCTNPEHRFRAVSRLM